MIPGDHIAVVLSGDRKSAALLCFLKKLVADRRDIRLSAVAGGIETCPQIHSSAVMVAESLRIPLAGMPLPGAGDSTMEEPVTRLATAVSLDDIAEGLLGQFLFGNAGILLQPLPEAIPIICPFMSVPSEELDLYWAIEGTGIDLPSVVPGRDAPVPDTVTLLRDFSRRHPATSYALLHLAEQLDCGVAPPAAGDGPGSAPRDPTCRKRPIT
jgi:hypothetical protein